MYPLPLPAKRAPDSALRIKGEEEGQVITSNDFWLDALIDQYAHVPRTPPLGGPSSAGPRPYSVPCVYVCMHAYAWSMCFVRTHPHVLKGPR